MTSNVFSFSTGEAIDITPCQPPESVQNILGRLYARRKHIHKVLVCWQELDDQGNIYTQSSVMNDYDLRALKSYVQDYTNEEPEGAPADDQEETEGD